MIDFHTHPNPLLNREETVRFLQQNGVTTAALLGRCWSFDQMHWNLWQAVGLNAGIKLIPGTEVHVYFGKPEMVSLLMIGCDLGEKSLVESIGPSITNLRHYQETGKEQLEYLKGLGYVLPTDLSKFDTISFDLDNPINTPICLIKELLGKSRNLKLAASELQQLAKDGKLNEWRYMPAQAWLVESDSRAPTAFEMNAVLKALYSKYYQDEQFKDKLVREYVPDEISRICKKSGGKLFFSLEKPGDEARLYEYWDYIDGVAVVSTRSKFNWQPERCTPIVDQKLLTELSRHGKLVIPGSDWDYYNRAPGIDLNLPEFPTYVRESVGKII